MRTYLIALAVALLVPAVVAADPARRDDRAATAQTAGFVPTGYHVRGCAYYRLGTDGSTVTQLCDATNIAEFRKALVDPSHPQTRLQAE